MSDPLGALVPLPEGYAATRAALQRVAVQVIARRRHVLVGRFGLRPAAGGFGMPAAGPEHEVLRTSGSLLVRERTGEAAATTTLDLQTATLADAAALAEVDLEAAFSVGHDTPPVGDTTSPLGVDATAASALGAWYAFAVPVLDRAVAGLPDDAAPTVAQLWPEHFDVGLDVGVGAGRRVNLGASPGDDFDPAPYLYVGPWDAERPGDPSYWNAPFGAVLRLQDAQEAEDPSARALDFLHIGLHLISGRTG